ncbi:putative aminoacyltransferase, E1 ubiquitin-activating enzyme [Medicago truncatula]|uniref:RING-type E3 ubiquitin transferase n=1 Tax=Medicago truncatula TaxID=3880 RepID=G7IWV6_MEDTR|nr:zinc finger, C3HC4 type (RING finger) family protein [Medicago truncatula]RHN66291.1 putative aminoacyltransferase, E1 ubiquitin-activating enzyme [Medicago truncatula]
MDEEEYHCSARPNMPSTVFDTNNISSHPGDKYFRIEFDYKKIWVQTDTNHQSLENIERYTLRKVSADKLMEETTIPSWLSHIKFPKEYFALMVEEILRCARDMVNGTTYNNLKFLCIRVDFSLTIPLEDDSCDEGDYGDEENLCLEEDKEEIEVGEEDNGLALPITSAIESETYEELDYEVYFEDDYRGYQWNNGLDEFEDEEEMEVEEDDEYEVYCEDDYGGYQWEEVEEEMEVEEEDDYYEVNYEDDYGGYQWNVGLEEYEDEEEMEVEEVDNRFVPAAKSFIEGLKMVEVEEVEKCAICFEDFNVGVRIPCSHMFHMTCICDWLVIGNSCPLCRFQLPT